MDNWRFNSLIVWFSPYLSNIILPATTITQEAFKLKPAVLSLAAVHVNFHHPVGIAPSGGRGESQRVKWAPRLVMLLLLMTMIAIG